MSEITNEQKLYVLLKYKKERTEKDEEIISVLKEKAQLGSQNLKEADKECCKQKWLAVIHHVDELGYTTKCYHTVELSESGLSQIDKFWRESKYNPKNVWKERLKFWTPVISVIVVILANYEVIWKLICKIASLL